MARVAFSVPTIDCEGCARAIRSGLSGSPGVGRVDVDVPARRVVVEYDPRQTTPEAVRSQLERIGFPLEDGRVRPPVREVRAPTPPPLARPSPERTRALWYWLLALGVVVLALAGYVGYVLYPRFGLPAAQGVGLLLLATGAGIASFFSPCSFPLLVTLLARQTGIEEARPGAAPQPVARALSFAAALSLGAAAFLLLSGVIIALGGEALFAGVTFTSTAGRLLRTAVGLLLIGLGLMQLGVLPITFHAVEHLSLPLLRSQARYRRASPVLGFAVLGFGYLLAGFG